MAKSKLEEACIITQIRAARLCRLLTHLAGSPLTREAITKKLKIDQRSFYRDLDLLRSLAIDISSTDNKYHLDGTLDEALDKLPVPDPGLSIREAIVLSKGTTAIHKKFRAQLELLIGTPRK